jgi:phage terminase large subunit
MAFQETTALSKIAALDTKIRLVQGGTAAGKTIASLLFLIAMAQTDKKKTLTSVVSESIPHLKRGALRDFKNIMQEHHYWKDSSWNGTDMIYTFETGSQIEFFSTDNGDKLRGARRDRCFMNEANNCTLDAFDQLEVRTKEFIILDWNPTNEFWVYTDIIPNRPDHELIIVTYKDNEGLSQEIIDSIEARRNRANWWKVYGEGQLGEVDGKIYTNWIELDEIPHGARKIGRGLDFGYSNDPSACTEIYEWNGGYILDEYFYRKGMSNKEIADLLKVDDIFTVADSAEPKSIDEIKMHGVTIVPSEKGQGSVNQGIALLQDQSVWVTKRSNNILKEYRNYLWERDRDGKVLNKPEHGFNHCFVADTLITMSDGSEKKIKDVVVGDFVLTSKGAKEVLLKHDNGVKEVSQYVLHIADRPIMVECTDNHKVKTGKTWTPISQLKQLQTVNCIKPSWERNTTYTRTSVTSLALIKDFIGLFTSILMDLSQKVATYIILTTTHTTIGRKIFVQSPQNYTYTIMGKKMQIGLETMYNQKGLSLPNFGMQVKKVKSGIQSKVKQVGSIVNIKNIYAKFVPKSSNQGTQELSSSVITTAKLQHLDVGESRSAKVYDLTVADAHEYFANGLLVHNCLDGVRYFLQRHLKSNPTDIKEFYNRLASKRSKDSRPRGGVK